MKEKKKSSIGCLFWIALILLILVMFLFNRKTIETVLDNTGFLEIFTNEEVVPDVERIENEQVTEESGPENEAPVTPSSPIETETVADPEEVLEIDPIISESNLEAELPAETISVEAQIRKSRLYFVKVDSEGNISLKGIIRPIYYTDSPLTETITNLLKGLSASEMNQGLLSLIPEGTQLISVSVKNGTANLNFTEEFLFNSFGVEGYTAQLEQIVFTTLEFSTVESVQILIGGVKKDFMGIEGGPYIGEPLNRDSF
ncbi:MAG: GerMN domain-containing protein [Spirochaetales bacterium]|nr:GerMN domain-containing protein [Spirochaetales bacterium]